MDGTEEALFISPVRSHLSLRGICSAFGATPLLCQGDGSNWQACLRPSVLTPEAALSPQCAPMGPKGPHDNA